MNFQKIQVFRYKSPFASPLSLKSGIIKERQGIILKATDGEHRNYLSESAPLPGFSEESLETAVDELSKFGINLLDSSILKEKLCPSNLFALSCLFQKFDEGCEKVEICKYVHGTAPNMLESIKLYRNASHIKIKLGHFGAEEAAAFVNKASLLTSKEATFRIDLNQLYDHHKLNTFCSLVDLKKIDYIEEPIKNPFELSQIYHNVKYALDESIRTFPIKDLINIPKIKALVIKPTLDMSKLLDQNFLKTVFDNNLDLIFSSTYESLTGYAHITKLAKKYSSKNCHGLDTQKLFKKNQKHDLKLLFERSL